MTIALALLAPSAAHLRMAGDKAGALWTEICSVYGRKLVKLAADDATSVPADQGDATARHCVLCVTPMDGPGLPPSVAILLFALSGTVVFPFLFYRSPGPLFAWVSPPSRAPPARR